MRDTSPGCNKIAKVFKAYRNKWVVALLISLVTASVFMPALKNGFLNWDDDLYVFNNPHIHSINLTSIKWMLTAFYAYNWHPLTWLVHALDYAVWGLNPAGHHLTNVILHALNTFLVVIIVFKLMERETARGRKGTVPPCEANGNISTSFIVASVTGLLFGLHPIHVESVAWVSETKDVLCSFFYLLTIAVYISYTDATKTHNGSYRSGNHRALLIRRVYYALSLLFFSAALLSKPMAVTLPLILILLDIYPLERLHTKCDLKSLVKIFAEKIPFFLLSISVSLLTVSAHELLVKQYSLWVRLLVSMKAFAFYLFLLVLPANLAPLYPYPHHVSLGQPRFLLSFLLLVTITASCIFLWKKTKVYLTLWLYYIITLLPVIGLIQVGKQSAADRYMYLPSIGPFILIGLLAAGSWRKASEARRFPRALRGLFCLVVVSGLTCFSYLTIRQIPIWKNTITLFSYEISQYPDFPDAYTIRGLNYTKKNDYTDAIEDFSRSIQLNPDYAPVYKYRGDAYEKLGRFNLAIADYNKSISINNRDPLGYSGRGDLYFKLGKYKQAISDYERAGQLMDSAVRQELKEQGHDPNKQYARYFYKCAEAYEKLGKYDKALINFDKTSRLVPDAADIYNRRGMLFGKMGNYQKALLDFSKAIKINPAYMPAYNNRAGVFTLLGKYRSAIKDLNTAVRLDATSVDSYVNLGVLYLKTGNNTQAFKDFQAAARLGDNGAQNYLKSRGVKW